MHRIVNIILVTCLLLSIGLNIQLLNREEPPIVVEVERTETPYRVVAAVEYSPEPVPVILTEEQRIDGYIVEICEQYEMNPNLIRSVIWKESRGNTLALGDGGTSHGLMQVSEKWHKARAARLGVTDFKDPYSNILLGVDYLSELQAQTHNIEYTLMLYNMNHSTAKKLFESGVISSYAKTVLERTRDLSIGGV